MKNKSNILSNDDKAWLAGNFADLENTFNECWDNRNGELAIVVLSKLHTDLLRVRIALEGLEIIPEKS